MATLLRRRKLGLTSCREISSMSNEGLNVIRNDSPWPDGEDTCIRWGTISNVPDGVRVINKAAAIKAVADKRGFRKILSDAGVCQKTWTSINSLPNEHFPQDSLINTPFILRTKTHAQGRGMWVVRSLRELRIHCNRLGEGNYYFSRFIDKVAEFRVLVMQGRVVWVAEKTPGNPQSVAWNVAKGGRFDNVKWDNWNPAVVQNAIDSWALSGLHFGGVDVMLDAHGNAFCLEINSAPSQTSPYRQLCMSKAFDWVVTGERYEVEEFERNNYNGWRSAVHPAVTTAKRGVG